MLAGPPRPADGVLAVADAPGIGCQLDADVMERYGTRLSSS
jgi:L-alanine-DL-glutamate epimerase-like enolase superfamily enzyme